MRAAGRRRGRSGACASTAASHSAGGFGTQARGAARSCDPAHARTGSGHRRLIRSALRQPRQYGLARDRAIDRERSKIGFADEGGIEQFVIDRS